MWFPKTASLLNNRRAKESLRSGRQRGKRNEQARETTKVDVSEYISRIFERVIDLKHELRKFHFYGRNLTTAGEEKESGIGYARKLVPRRNKKTRKTHPNWTTKCRRCRRSGRFPDSCCSRTPRISTSCCRSRCCCCSPSRRWWCRRCCWLCRFRPPWSRANDSTNGGSSFFMIFCDRRPRCR